MQQNSVPKTKHLVLLGGGHSHLAVLMHFAKNPLPGLAITLISQDIETPYSGALPAYIRGEYTHDQMHIDLRPLAQMAGARLIHSCVDRIDADTKQIHCMGRPAIPFDLLSVNIGSRPAEAVIAGAQEHATGVKPIAKFIAKWHAIVQSACNAQTRNQAHSIAVIGGGAASVELALAMHSRLLKELGIKQTHELAPSISIICRNAQLLAEHGERAQAYAHAALAQRCINVHLNCEVSSINTRGVDYHSTQEPDRKLHLPALDVVLATGASAPSWLAQTGVALNDEGFIRVNEMLQSISHPWIFSAGDIAAIETHPRPKSGVYAVRQGPPLAENLRRYAASMKLKRHVPQKSALALISISSRDAIASRNQFSWRGRAVALWKRWIDDQFLLKFQHIAPPKESAQENSIEFSQRPGLRKNHGTIRCSGCGAKVGGKALKNVLTQLSPCTHDDIVSQHAETEDAAIIRIDEKRIQLQSVDHFRAFINDPYLFAKIATVHCLSDIHAMGAHPHSALAIVSVPFASPTIMEATLLEVMSGCTQVLNEHDTALIGGHTSEASELSFGLSVSAFAAPDSLLRKSSAKAGDALILCKPIGTGTLFAADMRYQAKHQWIAEALEHMQMSNQAAAQCFVNHRANACTDITGFGLIGHLQEMLAPCALNATLRLDAIPVLDGALDSIRRGYTSSLQSNNASIAQSLGIVDSQLDDPRVQILFDPQTAGGLLATLPMGDAEACLKALRTAGYALAAHIGELNASPAGTPISITLV